MTDKPQAIHSLIPHLSTIELLLLTALIAEQHVILRSSRNLLGDAERDVADASRNLFGFSVTSIHCSASTTLEDISKAVLQAKDTSTGAAGSSNDRSRKRDAASISFQSSRSSPSKGRSNTLDTRQTHNVAIVRDLHLCERNVQVQCLELMRSRRIYSRSAVHSTPKRFLFVALLDEGTEGPPFFTPFLNDWFFMCDGFEQDATDEEGMHRSGSGRRSSRASQTSQASRASASSRRSGGSLSSIVRRPSPYHRPSFTPGAAEGYINPNPAITDGHLSYLIKLVTQVRPSAAMSRHIHNIPSHLRLHRHVKGGVSAVSTRHLNLLCRVLAVLQLPPAAADVDVADEHTEAVASESGIPVITPTTVALASEKVYAHRVELVKKPEDERSMQWGSDYGAVAESLRTASVEKCIEDAVLAVEVPA